jgi:hypothetical protein
MFYFLQKVPKSLIKFLKCPDFRKSKNLVSSYWTLCSINSYSWILFNTAYTETPDRYRDIIIKNIKFIAGFSFWAEQNVTLNYHTQSVKVGSSDVRWWWENWQSCIVTGQPGQLDLGNLGQNRLPRYTDLRRLRFVVHGVFIKAHFHQEKFSRTENVSKVENLCRPIPHCFTYIFSGFCQQSFKQHSFESWEQHAWYCWESIKNS